MTAAGDRFYVDILENYLGSDEAPEECMQLSDLDGFLTGLACGPEPIEPAEWMPIVWGDEPHFAEEQQRAEMESAILCLYAEIVQTLNVGKWTSRRSSGRSPEAWK